MWVEWTNFKPQKGVTSCEHYGWFLDHDDVIKWKQFPRYWPFVRGIHRSPVNSPHKGQWRGALMFTLIGARINGWVNNREAGDLRRYRGHYYVTVMFFDDNDYVVNSSLQWRHNGRDGVSNHQPHDCLLNHLSRRRAKKTSKLRATGHCAGNSPVTGEFPAKMASNAGTVFIWWRHHVLTIFCIRSIQLCYICTNIFLPRSVINI